MAKGKRKRLDAFHWHEALDRSLLAFEFFTERVAEHDAVQSDKNLRVKAEKISGQMFDLYQKLGAKTLGQD